MRDQGEVLHLITSRTQVFGNQCAWRMNQDLQLWQAAREGDAAQCMAFIKGGANVNVKGTRDWTVLNYAAAFGHAELCAMAAQRGADINARNENKRTSLHLGAKSDHVQVCNVLLEHGADVHAQDHDGWTALHLAAMNNHPRTCIILLNHGASMSTVDHYDQTALNRAQGCQSMECINAMRAWVSAQAARQALQEIAAGAPIP